MEYRALKTLAGLAIICSLGTVPGFAQTSCVITGPSAVGVNEAFTLCGPTGSGYEYEWNGPGVGVDNDARCVTARVPETGTYEFLLIVSRYGVELDRCRRVVNVGGSTGGARSCAITGPTSIRVGETAGLCGPDDGLHTYRWTGPSGFTSTSACVTVGEEGTYTLTSRNRLTGSSRQCTHRLTVVGASDVGCDITGPTIIPEGSTVRLCAPTRGNTSYQWTGPGNYTSSSRCITVGDPGTYTVRLRNLSSGRTERCSQTLTLSGDGTGGNENPDDVIYDNCPRDFQFWKSVFADPGAADRSGFTQAELRNIARIVDERSGFFNWRNDSQGVREALTPGRPLTRRKQVARQYAALLANVAAGELDLTLPNGDRIGLDPDTRVSYPGTTTLRDLIAVTDRTLSSSRGNYARLNSTLNLINRGRGIDSTCD